MRGRLRAAFSLRCAARILNVASWYFSDLTG
jgi:hypothetical protein